MITPKRASDARIAEIEQHLATVVYTYIRNDSLIAKELLQFLKAERACLDRADKLPEQWRKRNLRGGVHTMLACQYSNELESAIHTE